MRRRNSTKNIIWIIKYKELVHKDLERIGLNCTNKWFLHIEVGNQVDTTIKPGKITPLAENGNRLK